MGVGVFNIAKGEVVAMHNRVNDNDPANSALIVVLLKLAEADATLEDYDDLGTLLAAAGNTEATATGYVRKTLTDSDIVASTVDDSNNRQECDIPNQTWTSLGNGTNDNLVKALICYDSDTTSGTDTNVIPLVHLDFVTTTDNTDRTLIIHANGYFRAA